MLTLLQATAITERWGTTHYGQLAGLLSAPVTLATALAPGIGAVLATELHGYAAMFLIMSGVSILAACIGLGSIPSTPRTPARQPF
jgi:MFS family permease